MSYYQIKKNLQNPILQIGVLSLILLPSLQALAGPEGGVVVRGNATIDSVGNKTDIVQSSQKAIIDWRSFDIQNGEHTQFHQPSSSSVTLNRIYDNKASAINGRLSANGHVMLINPNGIVFGAGSQVDVGSLTASTADIDNDDFIAGHYDFNASGNASGQITNHGAITVGEAGLVTLVAPLVENQGVIRANLGKVQLSGADKFTLDLAGDGLIQVAVSDADAQKIVRNSGSIETEAGVVSLSAVQARDVVDSLVNHSGVIQASSVSRKGGKVYLGADQGRTRISGTIDASGTTGGDILIGGDYQGAGTVKTSKQTLVTDSAVIKANATNVGDGGKVIVWADETTNFVGSIEAKGGFDGGNGGFVETSGKKLLQAIGSVDASAVNGQSGQWLLDPNNITIQNAGPNTNVSVGPNFLSTDNNAIVTTGSIETALNAGTDVTVQTTSSGGNTQDGDIDVDDDIDKTSGGDATLTLKADNSIFINSSDITSTSGALNVVLNSDADNNDAGAISLSNSSITTNGGDFTAGGGLNPLLDDASGTTSNDDGIDIRSSAITTGAGNISLRGHALDNAAGSYQYGVGLLSGATLQTTTGNITLNGIGGAGDDNNYGVLLSSSGTLISSVDGAIDIMGQGGSSGAVGSRNNHGIEQSFGADITSTGVGANAATITLNGTAGAGNSNYGVYLSRAGTLISSMDGAINITGQGGANGGSNNHGIVQASGAFVTSTGVGDNAATITLNGTGGAGDSNNYGTYLTSTGTLISSVDGAIDIMGQGGSSGAVGSNHNNGFYLNRANVTSTGVGDNAATITLNGTAGAGDSNNRGVYLSSTGTLISSVDGAIDITGQGNTNGIGSHIHNYGIQMGQDINITSTGTGSNAATITLNGTGGAGYSNNYGVYSSNLGALISSMDGAIDVTGQGGSDGTAGSNFNHGILLQQGDDITSTGTGSDAATITLNGTGGAGEDDNYGVYFRFSGTPISSVDGAIDITGQGGSNGLAGEDRNRGVYLDGGAVLETTGTANVDVWAQAAGNAYDIVTSSNSNAIGNGTASGDFTFNVDTASLLDLNVITSGDVNITPRTSTTSIGLGSGAGTLNLTNSELDSFDNVGGTLTIGQLINGTGGVQIDNVDLTSGSYGFHLYGGAIDVNNGLSSAGQLWFISQGSGNDLTLNSGNVTTTGGGDSLVLSTEGNFINNVGANVLNPGAGRFLVYTSDPATAVRGGLVANDLTGKTFLGNSPSTILPITDNYFIDGIMPDTLGSDLLQFEKLLRQSELNKLFNSLGKESSNSYTITSDTNITKASFYDGDVYKTLVYPGYLLNVDHPSSDSFLRLYTSPLVGINPDLLAQPNFCHYTGRCG